MHTHEEFFFRVSSGESRLASNDSSLSSGEYRMSS